MSLMNVAIPSDFFLREAKAEYANIRERLPIELIQNSVDAGATEVRIKFMENGYYCEDNGCGMDWDTLRDGLLTLGGTVKSAGSTGGFGAAKKLLLFAHASYTVHTRNNLVFGSCLTFEEDRDAVFFQGTHISVEYLSDEDETFSKVDRMVSQARSFLQRCNLSHRCKVFINDKEFVDWANFQVLPSEALPFGSVYFDKENAYSNVNVLHNGLFMFSEYIWSDSPNTTVNVTAPSREVFAQSRDAFIGTAKDEFSKLKKNLINNPKSAGKPKPMRSIYRGIRTSFSVAVEKIKVALGGVEVPDVILGKEPNMDELVKFFEAASAMAEARGDEYVRDKVAQVIAEINVDFFIDHIGLSEKELAKLHPKSGLRKYRNVASLYRILIEEIAKAVGASLEFSVGFVAGESTEARYRLEDGRHIFLIDPTKVSKYKGKELFWDLYAKALHEFVHYYNEDEGHNEFFSSRLTFFIARVTPHVANKVVRLTRQATNEIELL